MRDITALLLLCTSAAYLLMTYFRWCNISVLTDNGVLDPSMFRSYV
jgi:hypothetical protein